MTGRFEMGRVISTEGPGKTRNQHRRTIAEVLRILSQKQELDEEVKDLATVIVFSLHGIADTVEQTTAAWDKKNYYLKADRFRREWAWVEEAIEELSDLIYRGRWDRLPGFLARLAPRFADVKVSRLTRNPSLWKGAYRRFMDG